MTNHRVATSEQLEGPWNNRLAGSASPYLRQHAHNPVDWRPWSQEAFAEAERRDVQVFLSIGYAACHWCHVMEEESFSDPRLAAFLNEHFVCIKVDREERPDVDALYIQALIAMGEPAGWPASLWLSPGGVPLYGGTYFPPTWRHGTPGFGDVLRRMENAWREGREGLLRGGERVRKELCRPPESGPLPGPGLLDRAVGDLLADWDPGWPGWGHQARFPMPPTLEMMLHQVASRADAPARQPLEQLLDIIDRGGLQDHVGGGFHRYCVDSGWEVPHFEKMLYDNAQLLRVYSRAARVYERPRYAQVARDTGRFLLEVLADPDTGLFRSSLDADTEGEEGSFYVWRPEALKEIRDGATRRALEQAYGLGGPLNFEGRAIVLNRSKGVDPDQEILRKGRLLLQRLRDRRPSPAIDDKIVVGWNGLAIGALAEAGLHLKEEGWVNHAVGVAEQLLAARRKDGTLPRTLAREAPAGVLLDHAAVVEGLLALHAASGDKCWLLEARSLALATVAAFRDPDRGDYRQSLDSMLLAERRSLDDGAEPSGQGRLLATLNALEHLGCTGLPEGVVSAGLESVAVDLASQPAAWPGLVVALADHQKGGVQVVAGARDAEEPGLSQVLEELGGHWLPGLAVGVGHEKDTDLAGSFEAFLGRGPSSDGARAYVCIGRTCGVPVGTPDRLRRQLLGT